MTRSIRKTALSVGGLAGLMLASACSPGEDATAPASLAGSSWTVTAIGGQAPIVGRDAPSIVFDGEGRVSGTTGCNRFSGGFAIADDGGLALGGDSGELATTRMACAPELNDQEARMLAALSAVAGFSVEVDQLTLTDASGAAAIEAVASPAAGTPR